MKQLNIQLIERYSGIKAHTIRMWEHRYGLFNPQRSAGNRRYYHIEDFSLILYLAILTRYGYSISSVSRLSTSERKLKIQQLERTPAAADIYLNKLILHSLNTDIISFEQVLNEFVKSEDIKVAVRQIDAWVTHIPPGDKTNIQILRDFASEYVTEESLLIATSTSPVQNAETGTLHYQEIVARLSRVFQL